MSLRASLLLLALLPACRPADPTPPAPATPPRPAASVVAAASVTASASAAPAGSAAQAGVCHDLLASNRAILAGASAPPGGEQSLAESCFPTAHGAWGLRLDRWKAEKAQAAGEEPGGLIGQFTVVHLPDGAEARRLPKDFGRLIVGPTSVDEVSFLQRPVLFDYDGDGEPEIFLTTSTEAHEGATDVLVALLSWKKGAVATYPGLPDSIKDIKDLDGDGRPDFLYYPAHQVRSRACSGFDFRWDGPALVAHSLPGGAFSLDDKVARDHLARTCPAPAKGKTKSDPAACENCPGKDCRLCTEQSNPPELCARLHGASEKQALALLQGACKPPAKPEEACQIPKGVCGDFPEREKTLRALKPAPGMPQP